MRQQGVHVGIIPDGTRRWAQNAVVPLAIAYERTLEVAAALLVELHTHGCTEATLYCVSGQNLGRPRGEIEAMVKACRRAPTTFGALQREGLVGPVTICGTAGALPSMVAAFAPLVDTVPRPGGMGLNLLIAYDPWEEIREAVGRVGDRVGLADLAIPRPVDSIIRTAGGVLLSGFMPLQSAFAQLVVSEKLFNDLTRDDLVSLSARACAVRHQFGL
ncbi:MAG: undecaprenyl diphosphate synthase family protein [Sandaracinaceae bacterium]|nr:undecaprenyl diphosphate synthase family protein [Sandaracinaceae bacterium]